MLVVILVCTPAVLAQKNGDLAEPPAVKKELTPAEKEQAKQAATTGLACMLVGVIAGLVAYFVPTIIAMLRGHSNMAPIIAVNFFLGWSLIGWVVALSWALTAQEKTIDKQRR